MHPGRPENISGSIQDAKFSVLSKAVGLSPFKFSTHAINSFSHSLRIEKKIYGKMFDLFVLAWAIQGKDLMSPQSQNLHSIHMIKIEACSHGFFKIFNA